MSEGENGVTEPKESVTRVTTLSAEFERWFRESGDIKKWKSRYRFIAEKMAGLFESKKELREFLNKKMNDAYRAMAVRRTKWHRRAYFISWILSVHLPTTAQRWTKRSSRKSFLTL